MRRIAAPLLTALTVLTPALPAQAADGVVPKGCAAFMTVQSRSCTVEILWRCDAEPEGHHWSAAFDQQGLLAVSGYDDQYQWLDTSYMWDNSREILLDSEDPIHMDDLLAEGIDTFAFTVRRSQAGMTQMLKVIGADQLTGKTVTIDGIALEELSTQLRYFAEDGSTDYQSQGRQYVSRDLRLFFSGLDEVIADDGGTIEYDYSPVDIIHPDDPGFGSTTPLYGCEEIKTRLPRPQMNTPAFAPVQPSPVRALIPMTAPKGESQ